MEIEKRHAVEVNRLYDKLTGLEPGTKEYEDVLNLLMKAKSNEVEFKKAKDAEKAAKNDFILKIVTFGAGLAIAPAVDILCKRSLVKYIGTIEQMEYFTSTPGRSLSGLFRWGK